MERILLRTAKFEYKVIEPIYEEQAVNIVTEAFLADDPVTKYEKYTKEITSQSIFDLLNSHRGRELSVICLETSKKEVCGAYFCYQMNKKLPNI